MKRPKQPNARKRLSHRHARQRATRPRHDLELRGVSHVYPDGEGHPIEALAGVDLKVPLHGMTALLGRSGSGKSTGLHLIAGLERLQQGEIILNELRQPEREGGAMRTWRRRVAVLLQEFSLLPDLRVIENVALPALLRREPWRSAHRQAEAVLEQLGIAELARRSPATLSGGQKQRVAIARALAMEPEVLLADEPTGALDPRNAELVMRTLRHVTDTLGVAVILVTHDRTLARRWCHRLVVCHKGRMRPVRSRPYSLHTEVSS